MARVALFHASDAQPTIRFENFSNVSLFTKLFLIVFQLYYLDSELKI